jgi:hypothetical protein
MVEVILTFPTPEGSKEIRIEGERTSFGRGSDADHRFPDNSLSRLHATVYRDGDRVWIVDENSANGTFVNGVPAAPAGTPLKGGEQIRIGNETVLSVHIRESSVQTAAAAAAVGPQGSQVVSSKPSGVRVLPIALIGMAFMIFSVSAIFVVYRVFARGIEVTDVNDDEDPVEIKPTRNKDPEPDKTPKSGSNDLKPTNAGDDTPITADAQPTPQGKPGYSIPSGKKYLDLSETERREYLSDRGLKIAQIIGNSSSEAIPAAALDKIKGFADGYARRVSVKAVGGCKFGDNLQVTYERASKNAPFIVKAFNERGTDPRIGLYLAMIESEHCVCLQSPTGPLGMFQFTQATGRAHGLNTRPGASPSNPDERCEPEPSARAAASYMKSLLGRYGTGPSSVPLAIGSYNSGEGGLSTNLVKALESDNGLPRDFWTLIANGEKLSKQFQSENFKYVPKFFAAAIIGEYPQDFGLKLQPLSTYSK